jgi:hypothetical protein
MAAPLDFGSFYWIVIWVATILVVAIIALVHEFVILPPIAKDMRKAKWSKGVPAFIQNDAGNVVFLTSDKQMPEGVIHNKLGWFLLPRPTTENEVKDFKRGPGRPPKIDASKDENPEVGQTVRAENIELMGKLLHTPILKGLGKQVFFGATSSAMLTNLWTMAHADLLQARRLIPMNTQKTQLDALATGSRIEGMKMMGGDLVKWIFYVIIACIPIVIIALVFWFLRS